MDHGSAVPARPGSPRPTRRARAPHADPRPAPSGRRARHGRARHGRCAAALLAVGLGSGGLALAGPAAAPAGATPQPAITFGSPVWTQRIADAGSPIALSSPNVAQLPGGPAVVVGDRAGTVYAYDLASGKPVWSYAAGAPVTSTPSVAPTTAGSGLDSVFVGTGNAAFPTTGGYQAISPTGGDQWFVQESNPTTDPTPHSGVQASMAVGYLQGGTDVVAGSLGENEYAMTAAGGGVLPGFPWFQGDSNFSTPAVADLYGSGDQIVEGGDSTAGIAYTTQYSNGGHIRVLNATGNAGQPRPNGGLVCQYTTNETVYSSPAVGEFLGSSHEVGIVVGTGDYYHQADTDRLVALDAHCNLLWSVGLDGNTQSSPALADVLGNGQLQVVEGTDNGTSGSVYAVDGSTGRTIWRADVGRVIGSVVTADLGTGHQDVLAPTTDGVVVLTGATGGTVTTLAQNTAFQNSPLVTDTTGVIGVTLAGYQSSGSVITHYRVAGTDGGQADAAGAWPQFHHDPSLSGDAGTAQNIQVPCAAPAHPAGYYMSASDGGIFAFGNLPFCGSTGSISLDQPVVGMAATGDGGGYWEVASDGGIFAFGNAPFYGSMGGQPLNRPVVGIAATPTGGGYWEVASDGGIFAFGNAPFYGSMGGRPLNQPIVGIAATPTGGGYWEVASDGGIFAFGNAPFYGSMGGRPLNQPVVGIAATPTGGGYWEVASDGGIFAFGNAPFYGSMGGRPLNQPIVAMEPVPGGAGYRFAAADGGIFAFGTAPFYGSMGGQPLNRPVVAMAGF